MANKARNQTNGARNAPWFNKKVAKNKKRSKNAKAARRRNR